MEGLTANAFSQVGIKYYTKLYINNITNKLMYVKLKY